MQYKKINFHAERLKGPVGQSNHHPDKPILPSFSNSSNSSSSSARSRVNVSFSSDVWFVLIAMVDNK